MNCMHNGVKNKDKSASYEPYYLIFIVACTDGCQDPMLMPAVHDFRLHVKLHCDKQIKQIILTVERCPL